MMVVGLYAFHQHQNLLRMRAGMMRSEATVRATGVAIDRLEALRAVSFDEATRSGAVTGPEQLTPVSDGIFPPDTPGDDLDDFDGSIETVERATAAGVLHFRVQTEVTYVDEVDRQTEVTTPTKFKKAIVKVYNLDLARPDTVYLAQLYGCGGECDW